MRDAGQGGKDPSQAEGRATEGTGGCVWEAPTPRHPGGAEVLMHVVSWWPWPWIPHPVGLGLWTPHLHGIGAGCPLFWGRIRQHCSCISALDGGQCSPPPAGSWVRETWGRDATRGTGQPFWHSYYPLSLLILQKFLISSVALPGRQAHIWSYGGKRTALPASGQFSPLRASSLAGCRSNLTLGGEGMGGAGAGATQS